MRLNDGLKLSSEGLHRHTEEFMVGVQKQGKEAIRSVCSVTLARANPSSAV